MINIGLDLSINSTGICIWDTDKNNNTYYIITPKITKRLHEIFKKNIGIHVIKYDKEDYTEKDYSSKESIKFMNICKISKNILSIIKEYQNINNIYIEGISYGSRNSSSLIDLAFLNACVRKELFDNHYNFIIVSPSAVKKFACANGNAQKDIIIDAWKKLDLQIKDIEGIKTDDIADAFFLAHYEPCL